MQDLESGKVFRAGATARTWNFETSTVSLGSNESKKVIKVCFKINSKGGGVTEVMLEIGVQDFPAVAEAMLNASRHDAMSALANSIAAEVAAQPSRDRATASRARTSVIDAASAAYMSAPAGNDLVEQLVRDAVVKLVSSLNEGEPNEEIPF